MSTKAAACRTFPADLPGEFETHVTFTCADAEVDALVAWGKARGTGATHILLERGRTVSQPMLTLRAATTLAAARAAAAELACAARADGFHPVRIKIEAAPWHPAVPVRDEDAAALEPAYHFEHHVKLLLGPDDATGPLAALAVRHSAHLSRNARRKRDDGRHERFVTQRCRAVGDRTAAAALDLLVTELTGRGHEILSVEREFVVFDDDETLDRGWIDETAEPFSASATSRTV
ncbi:hypothetical protein [Yinghuangia soli]|uniref:Ankyrin n=1 Tax=Yinghuangia soli TaxID=2908204 RepID=A0AA41Q285_9ACTN|nr:hypothetical protein [Yinghuangia soli]MCF2530193.1 hypothetical protein [Yinghuangia soli]